METRDSRDSPPNIPQHVKPEEVHTGINNGDESKRSSSAHNMNMPPPTPVRRSHIHETRLERNLKNGNSSTPVPLFNPLPSPITKQEFLKTPSSQKNSMENPIVSTCTKLGYNSAHVPTSAQQFSHIPTTQQKHSNLTHSTVITTPYKDKASPGTPWGLESLSASLAKVNRVNPQQHNSIYQKRTPEKSPFQSPIRTQKTIRKKMFHEIEKKIEFDIPERHLEFDDQEYSEDLNVSHDTSVSSISMDGNAFGKTPNRRFLPRFAPREQDGKTPGFAQFKTIPESGTTDRAVWLSPLMDDRNNEKHDTSESIINGHGFDLRVNSFDELVEKKVLNPRTKLNFNSLFDERLGTDDSGGRKKKHSMMEDKIFEDENTPARKIANRNGQNPFKLYNRDQTGSFPPPTGEKMRSYEVPCAPFHIGVDDNRRYSLSPTEAFRKELETTQCSPIRGNNEDMFLDKSPTNTGINQVLLNSPSHNTVLSTNSGQTSLASTATNKSKKLRPKPDMSAFDGGSNATNSVNAPDSFGGEPSSEIGASMRIPQSPMKTMAMCPPTPQRTPSYWKLKPATLSRQNSLVDAKILASCPQNVLDGMSSLENSFCVDDKLAQNQSTSSNVFLNESSMAERNIDNKSRDSLSVPTVGDESDHHDSISKTSKSSRLSSDFDRQGTVIFDTDFQNITILGRGQFADVYKAQCKSDLQYYAVKKTRRQFRGHRDRDQALAEIRIMQKLQTSSVSEWRKQGSAEKFKSGYCLYLLFFIRAWQHEGYLYSQTELCCRDTCQHLIFNLTTNWDVASKNYPSLIENLCQEDTQMDGKGNQAPRHLVPDNTIWKICHDVACGLSHIHSHNLVHHDIKPLNIFFVNNSRLGALCKIGDFGMAGEKGSCEDGQEGDAAYMPGELLGSAERDPLGDIFSLGITLYEIAAYGDWVLPRDGTKWHEIRKETHVPELPSIRSDTMVNLIKRMISPKKSDRPTADEILHDNKFLNDSAIQSDKFLADYIQDVDRYYSSKEDDKPSLQRKLSILNGEIPTPFQNKNSTDQEREWNVRTPTPMSGPMT